MQWLRISPWIAMHLGCLLVFVVGWSPVAVAVAVALYFVRMFAITAFYHRYFSHRTFNLSRPVQFLAGVLGASAAQRGPLWWAAHHRGHHRSSDETGDPHSPHVHGIFWSHMGWFTTKSAWVTDLDRVRDFAKFPELVWLDKHDRIVPLLLVIALAITGYVLQVVAPGLGTDALQMVVWGFCISTTVLFHFTACVNSAGHLFGRRVWPTKDRSRNSMLLALVTLGEGWHNNHHWCPGTVRQGFRWWQIDVTFYVLAMMSWVGLVSGIRPLPDRVRAKP
ncbi:MAG: acyl-CoA desaturase [bacterium]|nr:acyl-CoA desaturase [bacterium]